MKTKLLTAAIVSGIAAAASPVQAVSLNPLGVGQVLLYPYYTVNGGNDTYVSVVNTTNRGKAVKVRFMEGRNSRAVLELNLYMSPFDVWTGALISLDANGPANLLTRDRSCTVPDIVTNANMATLVDGTHYVPFRNFSYSGINNDNGGSALTRTREGHLEIIEMGALNAGAAPTQVEDDATHQSDSGAPNTGIPRNCGQLQLNWSSTGGAWGDDATGNRQLDISLPSGGLYGEGTIINVANGTLHAYSADAIEGFYGGTAAPGGLHFSPSGGRPTLSDASNGGSTIETRVNTSGGSSIVSTWNVGTRPDAVSAALMQDAIYNEFNSEVAIGGQSEWVISFPTRHFYTEGPDAPVRPFTRTFLAPGQTCEAMQVSFWDREELPMPNPCVCTGLQFEGCIPDPLPPECNLPPPTVCNAVQIETLNQMPVNLAAPSAIFGSTYAKNLDLKAGDVVADKGHIRMVFDNARAPGFQNSMSSVDGDVYSGLPVTGFWAANYVNRSAQPGKLANYSGAVHHRGTRFIVGS